MPSKNGLVDTWFSHNVIVPLGGDTVATMIVASDYLFWGSLERGVFDSILVPVQRRKGSGEALLKKVTSSVESTRPLFWNTSAPMASARLSSGLVAIVFADESLQRGRMQGVLYVSLIDLRARRTCVDAAVDVAAEPLPWTTFQADTLEVLTQEVSESGKATASVLKFTIQPERCDWIAGGAYQ